MPLLQLHGSPGVVLDDGHTVTLSAREAALLAWLHLEGPTARGPLAGRLWPGGSDAQARANLRQTLARLRRAAGELLVEDGGVLALAPALPVAPDAGRLLGAIEFDDAPELAEWLAARRDAAQRDRQRERLAAARTLLASGDLDGALAGADAALNEDAAVEEAHRVRMEVFYLRGDRAAAVTAWDDCRHALRSAFGIAPSAATRELGELILASDARPAAAAATLPAALRRPPRLIGREEALASMARALALGHGVVVAGVGGIGKTRLMQEAAAAMEPGVSVRARPGDHVLPGAVLSRLLAAAIEQFRPELDTATQEDIAPLLPGASGSGTQWRSALEHRRVLASVSRTLLGCHGRGMRLVLVDDLHFADAESMTALQVVVGDWLALPHEASPLAMFGARPDELGPAAAELVAMMERSGRSLRVDLAPIGAGDVGTLLRELQPLLEASLADPAVLAQALHTQVGGNPAFLLEALRSLWLDGLRGWTPGHPLPMPPTLVDSVRHRLQRLPPEALQLAQLAAVAGTDFSLALAGTAFGRAPLQLAPLLQALERTQVFHGTSFGHDLVAEAVLGSVPGALVPELHRIVARHLIASDGAPAAVAFHLDAAGASAEAAGWHLKAARLAYSRWQMAASAASFAAAARAADAGAALEGTTVALAWREAARCHISLSEYGAAHDALTRAFASASTPEERLPVRASQTVALWNAQRFDEVVRHAGELADELELHGAKLSETELAAALFGAVIGSPIHPEPQRLLALCERFAPMCLAAPDAVRRSFLVSHAICLNWNGWPSRALPLLDEADAQARAAGDLSGQVNIGTQRMRAQLWTGDTSGALATAEAALGVVHEAGHGGGFEADITMFRGLVELARGEPSRALAAQHEAQRLGQAVGRPKRRAAGEHSAALAIAMLAAGLTDEATGLLEPAEGDPPSAHRAFFAWAAARVAAATGQPAGSIERALADAASACPAPLSLQGLRQQVIEARLLGVPVARAEGLIATLAERGLRALVPSVHLAAAHAAAAEGRLNEAGAHAARALALADAVDPWIEDPAVLRSEAAALLSDTAPH